MNIEDARQALALAINDITPEGWQVSTATDPDFYTGLIHIGHASDIRLDAMGCLGFELTITAWIDETGDVFTVRDLYALLSMGDGSLLQFFNSSFPDVNIGEALVEQQFRRQSQFLSAALLVRLSYEVTD